MKAKKNTKASRFLGRVSCRRSEIATHGVKDTPIAEEYEHCVMCGAITCVPASMPVDWRENYQVGVGQICPECANKLKHEAP